MTPAGFFLTVMFCFAVAALPRRFAPLALLGATLYLTQGQAADIAGVNFMAIRFVEVAVFLRVWSRGELPSGGLLTVERWFLLFFCVSSGVLMLRTGLFDKYGVGLAIDACFVFFSFRALLATIDEYVSFLRGSVALLLPFAMCMVVEANTGRNLFASMGGVPEVSLFREGHYRCQGSFRSSIAAGSLGATFFPLFAGFLFERRSRWWALMGMALSCMIVMAARSSGPLMTIIVVICAWGCWPLRRRMTLVRRGIVATLVALHMVMKQPVWFIFDRISGFIGGDGWHRANLIDKFVKHFGEWWVWGMPMENTGDWAATKMPWGAVDVTNYYISIGLNGGLISVILFIALLTSCFKMVGRALQRIRERNPESNPNILETMLWGAGVAVCGHAINLSGVVYWDQIYVILYLHLAIAASLASYFLNNQPIDHPSAVAEDPVPAAPFASV